MMNGLLPKILVENGRCQGITAIEMRSGDLKVIAAKSVIICTGGAGSCFSHSLLMGQLRQVTVWL